MYGPDHPDNGLFTVPTAFSVPIQSRGAGRDMTHSFPLLEELEGALTSGTDARRVAILTSITDLFVSDAPRYSEDQVAVFDDIIVRLVNAIEAKARIKLAHRLAPVANAPSNVIHMLAVDDDIDVARPVLTLSARLNEQTLLATANSKSQQHLFAIAQRDSLSEAVTDILVERGDRDVVHSVVKNKSARFSDAGFRTLVDRSNGDDALASELGMRSDIPRQHFLLLLERASNAVRLRLSAENPQAGTDIEGVLAEVVGGIRNEARNSSPAFAAASHPPHRRDRNPPVCARPQVRRNGDRAIDPLRYPD
jgi:uncharacterized protein (DUF2336 family)